MKDNYSADVCIIGSGVVGCAIARELQLRGLHVLVLDRNEKPGMGVSSRNSEVIHAGIYYPTGSLKASLCVEGRKLLYEYCKQRQITHRQIGKLIIAVNKDEESELEKIRLQAEANGVSSLRYLSYSEAKSLEPEVVAYKSIFSPESGVVSVHELCDAFRLDAEKAGAEFIFRTEVIGIEQLEKGWSILTDTVSKNSPFLVANEARVSDKYRLLAPEIAVAREPYEIKVGAIINCAGLHSDWIAALAGIEVEAASYKLCWVKGEYFSLSSQWGKKLSHLIYPIPEKNIRGLGTHVTIDVGGQAKLGPNVVEISRSEDYDVSESSKNKFFEAAKLYLPNLSEEDISPAYSGIRPKLSKAGEPVRDFVIAEESSKGYPGLVSLIGIESPGLTSALAIAKKVSALV